MTIQSVQPPATPRLLRPVRWTEAQARALTLIARHGADRRLAVRPDAGLGHRPLHAWNIRMRPVHAQGISTMPSPSINGDNTHDAAMRMIGVDWDGARLWVRLSSRVCEDWLALRMPDLDVGNLPNHFVNAAWDALLHEALADLGIAARCPGIRVLADTAPDAGDACPHRWTVSIRSPERGRIVAAELAVDDAGLARLGELLRRLPEPEDGDAYGVLDGLPVPVVARVGSTTLSTAELRGLSLGDVVLFDHDAAGLGGGFRLLTPDEQGVTARACEPGASRYVVTEQWSSWSMNEYPPSDDASTPSTHVVVPTDAHSQAHSQAHGQVHTAAHCEAHTPAHNQVHTPAHSEVHSEAYTQAPTEDRTGAAMDAPAHESGLDRIPVRLVFDIGEQTMTLGELRRLRPGEFFDLQRPIDAGPVHIRANGATVGTAELVDIDGRIGARVLSLNPAGDTWG